MNEAPEGINFSNAFIANEAELRVEKCHWKQDEEWVVHPSTHSLKSFFDLIKFYF